MAGWNPWRAPRERGHVTLRWALLPHGTRGHLTIDFNGAVVTIDARLDQRQGNATLAHELVHDERGLPTVDLPPGLAQKAEHAVDRMVASRVPIAELTTDITRRLDLDQAVTGHFDVPHDVAARALHLHATRYRHRTLHPTSRRPTMTRRAPALAIAATLTLAACGSSIDDTTTTGEAADTTVEATTERADVAEDPTTTTADANEKQLIQLAMTPTLDGRNLTITGTTNIPDGDVVQWDLATVAFDTDGTCDGDYDTCTRFENMTVENGTFSATIDLTAWAPGDVIVWVGFAPVASGTSDQAKDLYGNGEMIDPASPGYRCIDGDDADHPICDVSVEQTITLT